MCDVHENTKQLPTQNDPLMLVLSAAEELVRQSQNVAGEQTGAFWQAVHHL